MEWVTVPRVFGAVFSICWVVYFALFAKHLRGSRQARESDPASLLGTVFQFAALGLLFWFRRETLAESLILNIGGLVLAVLALAMTRRALRQLGKHWSLGARIGQQHQLVSQGIYQFVRHPLYLAFLLLTLGTGVAFSSPAGVLLALPVSLCGAGIRIAVEERLLRQRFGKAYLDYASRVPSLFPRLGKGPRRRVR